MVSAFGPGVESNTDTDAPLAVVTALLTSTKLFAHPIRWLRF